MVMIDFSFEYIWFGVSVYSESSFGDFSSNKSVKLMSSAPDLNLN